MKVSKDRKRTGFKKEPQQRVPESLIDRIGGTSSALSENNGLHPFLSHCSLILSFLYFPSWGGGDYDMWWHFALGKYYLSHQYDEGGSFTLLLDTGLSRLAL